MGVNADVNIDALDPNLLASRKKAAGPLPVRSRRRRILKIVAYVWIFLAALTFFFYLKLPSTLLQGMLLGTLNQGGAMHWQAESLGFRFFLLPHVRADQLSMTPLRGGPIPSLTFDQLRIFPGFLSLLTLSPGFSFDGTAYGFSFEGYAKPQGGDFELSATNVDFSKLAPLLESGIDLKGVLTALKTELSLEGGRLSRASGLVQATGKNFVVDPASFHLPLPLPILDLGILELAARAQNGKLRLEKVQIGTPGKDLEIRLTGEITLSDTPLLSRADLRLRLRPSEKILSAMPAVKTMLGTMAALQPDGFYAMKLAGPLGGMGLPTPDR